MAVSALVVSWQAANENGRPVAKAAAWLLIEDQPERLAPPDGNGSGDWERTRAHPVTVIAGLNDPLAVFPADDLADVMGPDYHRSDTRRPGMSPTRPIARQVILRARVTADQLAHRPTAPGRRTAAVATMKCRCGDGSRRSVSEVRRGRIEITRRRVTVRIDMTAYMSVSAMLVIMLPCFCILCNYQGSRDCGH